MNDILQSLQTHNLNITKTAATMGITPAALRGKMKRAGVVLEKHAGRKKLRGSSRLAVAETIKAEYALGKSTHQICMENSWTKPFFYTICKEFGIQTISKFNEWKKTRDIISDNIIGFIEDNNSISIKAIAQKHNVSLEQLKRVMVETGHTTILHSYNVSRGELNIREFIRNNGIRCISQKIVDENSKKWEIDCLCPNDNFGVEYCGEYWHSTKRILDKFYHSNKTSEANKQGISLLTIFESEWACKQPLIESMILSRLGKSSKIMARKCEVGLIGSREAKIFHEKNHISGYVNSSVNVGLLSDGILVSVLSLSKSRFDKHHQYEITRYSTSIGMNVAGGFTKLFSHFVKLCDPLSVLTYADLRFGRGNVYGKAGFALIGQTPPNYWYYNKNKPLGLESRMKYQKTRLKKMFPEIAGTEAEIMDAAGYYRVYDCGNMKYSWKKGQAQ